MRDPDIQRLIDATTAAFARRLEPGTPIADLHENIFGALANDVGPPSDDYEAETLPVCSHLAPALVTAATGSPETAAVAEAFSHLGPRLRWRRRPTANAGPEFADNHANTVFVGADGLEVRHDVRIGASLVAPNTRYPDHDHPPEEMYLALSAGIWRNGDTDWTEPGIGGLFHNTPGITHAMRSGDAPLLTIWCLWSPDFA